MLTKFNEVLRGNSLSKLANEITRDLPNNSDSQGVEVLKSSNVASVAMDEQVADDTKRTLKP